MLLLATWIAFVGRSRLTGGGLLLGLLLLAASGNCQQPVTSQAASSEAAEEAGRKASEAAGRKAGQTPNANQDSSKPKRRYDPDSGIVRYDMLTRGFVGKNTPRSLFDVQMQHGKSVVFEVVNLNPLYRLKATYTPLDISYGIEKNPAFKFDALTNIPKTQNLNQLSVRARIAKLVKAKDSVVEAAQGSRDAFEKVRGQARQVALNGLSEKQNLDKLAGGVGVEAVKVRDSTYSVNDLRYVFEQRSKAVKEQLQVAKELVKKLHSRLPPGVTAADTTQLHEALDELDFSVKQTADFVADPEFGEIPKYWVVMRTGQYRGDTRDTPLQLVGDQVQVKLEVVRRPEFALSTSKLPAPDFGGIVFTIQVVGGLSLDVSEGLVFNRLFDRSYALEAPTQLRGDTVVFDPRYKVVRETGAATFKPGLATLLHLRYKVSPTLSLGLTGGASVVAGSKSIVQYHAGVSGLVGKRQRVVLTGGVSWGLVQRAAPGYTDGGRVPATVLLVPTVGQYQRSGMVSVTYNFTSGLSAVRTFKPDDPAPATEAGK